MAAASTRGKTNKAKSTSSKTSRKIKPVKNKKNIAGSRVLLAESLRLLKENRRIFGGIFLTYVLLTLVLVKGLSFSSNFTEIKDGLFGLIGTEASKIGAAIGLYGYALSTNSPQVSDVSGAYQLFITLIVSLAVIWIVRQVLAGQKVSMRNGFYLGAYPIVPFLLVLFVLSIQMIPFIVGNFLLTTVLTNGLAVTAVEKIIWLVVFAASALWTIYMVISSILALYISTLPDMTPLRALRSAKGLVKGLRLRIGWRLAAAPLFLLLLSAVIVIPLIMVASWSVEFVVMLLGGFSLIFLHVYNYLLYRALL